MNNYKIYFRELDGSIKVISDDFCWMALGLTWIWAFMENNKKIGIVLFLLPVALFVLTNILAFCAIGSDDYFSYYPFFINPCYSYIPFSLAIRFFLGVNGNAMSEVNLRNNGYVYMETMQAIHPSVAMMEYMEKTK